MRMRNAMQHLSKVDQPFEKCSLVLKNCALSTHNTEHIQIISDYNRMLFVNLWKNSTCGLRSQIYCANQIGFCEPKLDTQSWNQETTSTSFKAIGRAQRGRAVALMELRSGCTDRPDAQAVHHRLHQRARLGPVAGDHRQRLGLPRGRSCDAEG